MKKLWIAFIFAFMVGCNSSQQNITTTPSPEASPSIKPSPTEISTPVQPPVEEKLSKEFYYTSEGWNSHFDKYGIYPPTAIMMFLGENQDEFAMLHEYGVSVTNEDLKSLEKFDDGGFYTYYGKMTEVSENIYAVDGEFPKSWNMPRKLAGEGKDFYVVYKNEKVYIVFKPVTDFENIENYIDPDAYMK